MASAGFAAWLQKQWWRPRPSTAAHLLRPLSWLYALAWQARRWAASIGGAKPLPVPVIVVGNWVVGGAGKTPAVIALVRALRCAGRTPGVVSRGHGGAGKLPRAVLAGSAAGEVGDEPLLIHRSTGAPVFVGVRRRDTAAALVAEHPDVDVIVSDDGLQHLALPRQAEVCLIDERGFGNGLLLPAGPLRQPVPRDMKPGHWVLYNASRASTHLPGAIVRRRLVSASPLADWAKGERRSAVPIAGLRGPPLLAAAGIADPERFFRMLEAEGLSLRRLPLPDHYPYATLPWAPDTTEVVVTEKDAVKLLARDLGATRIWVVALDFALPSELVPALLERLPPRSPP